MKYRARPGARAEEWGPAVNKCMLRGEKPCSVCGETIAVGESALIRTWVYTFSHVSCGEPAAEHPRVAEEPRPPCDCGDVDACLQCQVRDLKEKGHRL